MFDKKELRTAADTLMSMCTSFLTGELKEEVFRSNLLLFAEQANPPKSETIDQSDSAKLVKSVAETVWIHAQEKPLAWTLESMEQAIANSFACGENNC